MPYDLLSGVRVIEASMYAFAPSAAAVLADWGADVIKVVPPDVADPMSGNIIAGLPDRDVGVAFMWEIVNRGKRCIALDLGDQNGREVLHRLVRDADVFLTNLLPEARERFEVRPEDLRTVNERLIYGRASGHGAKGDEAELGGFDHTDFWARTGVGHAASMVSDEFVPQVGAAFGDLASGAFLAGAVAAALVRRERTGQGAVVDVSLLSSGLWMFSPSVVASRLYDVDTIPRVRHLELPNPLVAAYQTRDGRLVYLSGVQTDKHFTNLATVVERLDLLDDERFETAEARAANAAACIGALDEIFARRDLADWLPRLKDLSTPWTVVQTAREAASDPQVAANGYLVEVEGGSRTFPLVASPARVDDQDLELTAAPAHGEHTEFVLLEADYDWDAITALKDAGAIP